MITIYSSEQAQQTILRRDMALEPDPPPALRSGLRRIFGEELTPVAAVDRVLRDVRARGDAALIDWTRRIDGVALERLAVDPAEIRAAPAALPADLWDSLLLAAERIRAFHALQPVHSWTTESLGGRLGQRVTPLRRVGVYVPGGTAPLPSSLLMSAIPAQVAGVAEIVVATPPGRDGRVPPVILAAAAAVGIETVYTLGGAQAVAALAFGTASVPRVDKIVGPGNLFVTLAKRQVFGLVGIDGLNGPTETVVIADETANPAWVAADLLAQAEHDTLATAILLTPSRPLAEAVQAEVARQMEHLSRDGVIAAALAGQGGIVLTADLAEAAALANAFAPEHLCIATAEPAALADSLRHAGGLFLGERSFEVLGDYVAGPSHTMPTGGTARFASPLNVLDFVRITSLIDLDARTTAELAPVAARLARAEALTAHANAADLRAASDTAGNTESASSDADGGTARRSSEDAHSVNFILPHEENAGPSAGISPAPPHPRSPVFPEDTVRPDIQQMEPYTPILPFDVLSARLGRAPEAIVKLDANENPYGPSPRALAALAGGRYYHIYPDPEANTLRDAISRYTGLPRGRLLAGMGADELIDLVLRAVLSPGDAVIDCPPSFGMYPFSTAVNAGRYVAVPRRDDFSLDVAGIEAAVAARSRAAQSRAAQSRAAQSRAAHPRVKVLFVCSPNNPDGSVVDDDTLRRLLALPVLVVLDEAYVDFAEADGLPSRLAWALEHENLIVLRTFSKLAALAGLRVGYGAFPAWLLPHLWKIKQPYNVNVAASLAAVASLEDAGRLRDQVRRLVAERERIARELTAFDGLHPLPSRANFVLCRVTDRPAGELKRALEREGVLVRYFDKPGLRNCIRVSAGRPEDTDRLVAALQKIMNLPRMDTDFADKHG